MASLYITEFEKAGVALGAQLQAAKQPPLATHKLTIGASAANSPVFNPKTTLIRITADGPCSFRIGAGAVATAGDARLAADTVEYFAVDGTMRASVIVNT